MSSMSNNPGGLALRAAADLLVSASELRSFSDPAIQDAFKLLRRSNPGLVDWVFRDLPEICNTKEQ